MVSYTSSSERSVGILVISAVLMCGAIALNVFYPDTQQAAQRREDAFWLHKVHGHAAGSAHIVLSGDSRVYRGLSPAVFEESLPGANVINFGFSGGGHNPVIFAEIDRLLKQSGKRAVVLGITPWSLTAKSQDNAQFVDFKRRKGSVDETKLDAYLRPLTWDHVKDVVRGKADGPITITQDFYDDGWVRSDDTQRNPDAAIASYEHLFDGNKVDADVVNRVLQQVSRWKSAGVIVIGYRPPTTKAMVMLENNASGFDEAGFVRAWRHAGGVWVNINGGYETFDGSHLTPESAEKLSKKLAQTIAVQP